MNATEVQAPPSRVQKTPLHRVTLALRFLVPVAVIAYLLSIVPLGDTLASLRAIPVWAFAAGFGFAMVSMVAAAVRWRLLFRACGIAQRPSVLRLLGLHMVGMFYNVCVPGGLGGDVVRAVAVRRVMGERGLPGALAIVLLERTLGAAGLLILVAATFSLFPLAQIPNVMMWSAIGLGVAAAVVFGIANASRIARFLPAPLAKVAAGLPTIDAARPFVLALLLSVFTQSCVIFVGHLLLASISQAVTFTQSMVVMPLVGASQYFPLTVGGAGVREAAFVGLFGMVGVAQHDALAASIAFGATIYATAGLGGLVQMLTPLTVDREQSV